jgi:pimeloyl-ACP methyl ester carboxylesterase
VLAAATITAQPAAFLATGVVAFLTLDALGAGVVARRARPGLRRAAGTWMFTTSAAPLLAVFAATTLIPPAASPPAPRPVLAHQQDVGLPAGSRLTVVRLPGRAPATRPPIVVVHGGPGIPDLSANTAAFAPLGVDVYLYAQRGSDTSTRLADPRGYRRDRDVSDLEALRARLGLDRMVLLGHSYGGAVAAAYLAEHRLILVSPGPLDPADTSGNRATSRLDFPQRLRLYSEVLAPRPLLGWALLQVDPAAAHAFLDDAEADTRNDAVLTLAAPALACHPSPARRR